MNRFIILTFFLALFQLTSVGQGKLEFGNDMVKIVQGLSAVDDPIAFAKKESKGGLMDFNMQMKNQKSQLFLFDGVAYNMEDFGILLWGMAANNIGFSKLKEAKKVWEEIYGKELSGPDWKAFKRGFKF